MSDKEPESKDIWKAKAVKIGNLGYQVQLGNCGIHDCESISEATDVAGDLNIALQPLVSRAALADQTIKTIREVMDGYSRNEMSIATLWEIIYKAINEYDSLKGDVKA